jgi:hypothetical protein
MLLLSYDPVKNVVVESLNYSNYLTLHNYCFIEEMLISRLL